MVDDLKRQASRLREQGEQTKLPTSDSLSMKRMFWITIAIAVVVLLAIQISGGFKPRQDPLIAANTPPPLPKEAPPPELLEPQPPSGSASSAAPSRPSTPPELPRQAAEPAAPPAAPAANPAPQRSAAAAAPPAAAAQPETGSLNVPKPVLKRDTEPEPRRKRAASPARKAAQETQAPPPAVPEPPRMSEIEIARRQLAREIVLEKNPALARLLPPNGKEWSAEPQGTDEYLVTFNIVDEGTGAPAQYVWRVNVATRSTTPLSYYARRLS
jgi:hypothetical protein